MESEDKFVILADYPYFTTNLRKDIRKIRNLCVKYDLHNRYIPLYEGTYNNGKYRQIGEIDLLNEIIRNNVCITDSSYPDDFIDVDYEEINLLIQKQ